MGVSRALVLDKWKIGQWHFAYDIIEVELWMWLYISLVRDELYRAVRFLAPEAFAMVSREGQR